MPDNQNIYQDVDLNGKNLTTSGYLKAIAFYNADGSSNIGWYDAGPYWTFGVSSGQGIYTDGKGYFGGISGLLLNAGSITDGSGEISFDNENLSTSGIITASEGHFNDILLETGYYILAESGYFLTL